MTPSGHYDRTTAKPNPGMYRAGAKAPKWLVKKRADGIRKRTVCKYGHSLTGSNVYVNPDGFRDCMICKRKRTLVFTEKNGDYVITRQLKKARETYDRGGVWVISKGFDKRKAA